MGFPVGYTDLYLPKIILYLLSILGIFRRIAVSLLCFLGFGDFLDAEITPSVSDQPGWEPPRSVSAALIHELLPVVKLCEVAEAAPESCMVCLNEFESGEEEIRWLSNCRHVFHRRCLDRWIDHDQKTCPLCRAQIVPREMQEAFNERLWAASGIADLYGDYSPITVGL